MNTQIKINGKRVRQYLHNNDLYVEGRVGTEYSVELKNNNPTRKLFVVSIDGVNAISGKEIDLDPHNGYIIEGYNSLDLKGFRIDNKDVAAFKFVKKDNSYAEQAAGETTNCGVVGVKVYDEKVKPVVYPTQIKEVHHHHHNNWWNQPPYYTNAPSWTITCGSGSYVGNMSYNCSVNQPNLGVASNDVKKSLQNEVSPASNNIAGHYVATDLTQGLQSMAQDSPPDFDLGTGWGQKVQQEIKEVEFEVGNLHETSILYYASKDELIKMGIDITDKPKVRQTMPSAFGEKKYCSIPAGWNG